MGTLYLLMQSIYMFHSLANELGCRCLLMFASVYFCSSFFLAMYKLLLLLLLLEFVFLFVWFFPHFCQTIYIFSFSLYLLVCSPTKWITCAVTSIYRPNATDFIDNRLPEPIEWTCRFVASWLLISPIYSLWLWQFVEFNWFFSRIVCVYMCDCEAVFFAYWIVCLAC